LDAAAHQSKRILKLSHDPCNIETLLIGWPMLTSSIISASVKEKELKKRYYDRTARPLAPLVVDDYMRSKIKTQTSHRENNDKLSGEKQVSDY